jgi:hypothetical protein
MFWAIPMALVGQDYSAVDERLSLDPKADGAYRLPFYTPFSNGVIERTAKGILSIRVLSGTLTLKELVVSGKTLLKDITLKTGEIAKLD